jgi:hypothetical protein
MLLLACLLVPLPGLAQDGGGGGLSAAQKQRITHAIDTLGSPAERRMAAAWRPAKQVAEVLCRPLALRTLRQRDPGVDKVFLGLGGKDDLLLTGNRLLAGRGQARHADGWKTFAFSCELDPATGEATRFTTR